MSGIYDLESSGRSVINKLNTNYSCFCILLRDVNKVLIASNQPELKMVGLPPFTQISNTKKLISIIDKYKERIFNTNSETFKNLMLTLGSTHTMGGETEDYAVGVLNKEFGNENVIQIGELGNKEDMIQGIDCKVKINGETKTCQIKPYGNIIEENGIMTVLNTGQVKRYTTDWLIFARKGKGVSIFDNSITKIVNGSYTFPKESLIYQLK